jgi:hypothetical protein
MREYVRMRVIFFWALKCGISALAKIQFQRSKITRKIPAFLRSVFFFRTLKCD